MSAYDNITRSIAEHRLNKWYYERFQTDNPNLAPAVLGYLDGGARPADSLIGENHYALGLVLAEDSRRALESDPSGLCLPRAQKDFGVPTSGDAQPRFQAMIDQLRSGDSVAVENGVYTFNNPVRMSKGALRIIGLGGQDKFGGSGARIQPGRDGITLFEDGHTSNVKHDGCTWEWINLISSRANIRGWDFKNCNSWRLLWCAAAGSFSRGSIFVTIPTTEIPPGDNAYTEIHEFAARQSAGPSLFVHEGGTMRVNGGYWDAPEGIILRQAGQVHMRGGKSNHKGRLLLCEGQLNTIDWDFEQYGSNEAGFNVYAVEILKNPSLPIPWSGNENRVTSRFVDHPYGAGKFLHVGPGPWGNVIDSFWQGGIGSGAGGPGQYYWNEGNNTQNRNPK